MPRKKYLTNLYAAEQQQLTELTRKGIVKAHKIKRIMILPEAVAGLMDVQIIATLNVSRPCIERIRKRLIG